MNYRSDSEWEYTDYKPFPTTEYESDSKIDWYELQEQEERYAAWRKRDQRYAHIGGSIILLMFFVGLPLIAAGIHELIHL
jgi:hypothetical protein